MTVEERPLLVAVNFQLGATFWGVNVSFVMSNNRRCLSWGEVTAPPVAPCRPVGRQTQPAWNVNRARTLCYCSSKSHRPICGTATLPYKERRVSNYVKKEK